jgi:site-specific DNA-methyltransferase (adenine-specific)
LIDSQETGRIRKEEDHEENKSRVTNTLYYGDNLPILKNYIGDESIDLIYLDPPFNSNQDYNVLFHEHDGAAAVAQINAFEDTWTWDEAAAAAYHETVEGGGEISRVMQGLMQFLKPSDMMAYLSMMAPRLVELHRVLKPTGSIYLHCDPTASHYIKLIMDAVFGPVNFRNEIIWKRTSGHSDARRYGRVHDTILYYVKSDAATWNQMFQEYDQAYVNQYYRYADGDGRRFMSGDLGASGLSGGGYEYEWKGVTRVWRCPPETMQRLDDEGRIFYTKNGIPRIKRYLDESQGLPMQDVWTDIEALRSWHQERLGYPTQKPEELLDRIIMASSNEGAFILDPFCGCGTAIASAERLKRLWIGIDITHLAVALIKHRLFTTYGDKVRYDVIGEPASLQDAYVLAAEDAYQFQWWAVGMVGARLIDKKKGADQGIDGRLYFHDDPKPGTTKQIILSVKSGHIPAAHIRELRGTVEREGAAIGVLLTLESPTKPMRTEAASGGFYVSPLGSKHPKLQIITIEELMDGRQIDFPKSAPNITYRRAKRYKGEAAKNQSLPWEEIGQAQPSPLAVPVPVAEIPPHKPRKPRR